MTKARLQRSKSQAARRTRSRSPIPARSGRWHIRRASRSCSTWRSRVRPRPPSARASRACRARVIAMSVGQDPDRPEAARAAGRLLVESLLARAEEMHADYLDREAEYPGDWQRAAGTSQDVLHVTPAELTEIRERIGKILAGYRRLRVQDQPAGARRVHAIVDFLPWFKPDDAAEQGGGAA